MKAIRELILKSKDLQDEIVSEGRVSLFSDLFQTLSKGPDFVRQVDPYLRQIYF